MKHSGRMFTLTQNRLEKFIKIVEWVIFFVLCIVSYFVTIGVWEQYQTYDSSFKKSEEPVFDGLTMVMKFWPLENKANGKQFEFKNDFSMSYSIRGRIDAKNLENGINIVEDDKMKIQINFEEMRRKNNLYYRISSNFVSMSEWAKILVHFNESILPKNLPQVEIHILSEKNSYGYNMHGRYFEGRDLLYIGQMGKELWVKVEPEKYIMLDKSQSTKSKCENNISFYESFDKLLIEKIIENCQTTCLPYSSINHTFPICKTEDEKICAYGTFDEVRVNKSFLQKCTRSCTMTQYLGTYEWSGNYFEGEGSHDFSFYYMMSNEDMIVYEEYLIQDLMSMMGSIGGTLGLFIGFSCSKLISIIINQLRNCLFHATQ